MFAEQQKEEEKIMSEAIGLDFYKHESANTPSEFGACARSLLIS